MTPKDLASRINGSDLKSGLEQFIDIAEDNGLAIAFCTDQELFEIKGAVETDYDVFRSETLCLFEFDDEYCLFDKLALGVKDDGDDYQYAAHEGAEKGNIIKVVLNPEEPKDTTWLVQPEFAYESFEVMKAGKVYCKGAVFALASVQ